MAKKRRKRRYSRSSQRDVESEMRRYKRGTARAVLGRAADANQDLQKAVSLEGRDWVHGRAHLELGKLALKNGNSAGARQEFEQTIKLCTGDNDPIAVNEARALVARIG